MTTNQLIRQHILFGLSGALLLAGPLWFFVFRSWSITALLLAWLAGINPVTFLYYRFDKQRARAGGRRVPEAALHGLSVVGGSLGAYLGMRWFRHKTIKGRFRILFWGIVVLQVALVALLVRHHWS